MLLEDPHGSRRSGVPPGGSGAPAPLPRGILLRVHPRARTDLEDLRRQTLGVTRMFHGGDDPVLGRALEQAGLPGRFTGWVSSQGIQYTSAGPRGEPRIYSGRVYLPSFWRRGPAEVPLVVLVHGLELARDQVQFFNHGPEAALGALAAYLCGFAVAMPDLPGLGLDPSPRPHPFCHARSLAQSVLDMVEPALASLDPAKYRWDGRLFLVGYSAGGYAALAAVREAQRNPAHAGLPLTGAACMGGPFHFHETIRGWILETGTPYTRPYVQTYLVHAYHDLHRDTGLFEPASALHPALLEERRNGRLDDGSLLRWFNGCLPGQAISPRIRLRLKGDPDTPLAAHEVLNPEWVRAQFLAPDWPDTPVGRILMENDLVGGWVPRIPLFLAASPADECVDLRNTETLMKTWQNAGEKAPVDFLPLTWRGTGLDHRQGGLMALLKAFWWIRSA
jgi:predicted esterase